MRFQRRPPAPHPRRRTAPARRRLSGLTPATLAATGLSLLFLSTLAAGASASTVRGPGGTVIISTPPISSSSANTGTPHCTASVTIYAKPAIVHAGQVASLQTIVIPGAPPVGACAYPATFTYSGLPGGCLSANNPTVYCATSNLGVYRVQVQVLAPWGLFVANTMLTVIS